jgi:tRNA/tmRNA/rRNA uracil-C5-methylase (TrmA/RlmC/RlmD family)
VSWLTPLEVDWAKKCSHCKAEPKEANCGYCKWCKKTYNASYFKKRHEVRQMAGSLESPALERRASYSKETGVRS